MYSVIDFHSHILPGIDDGSASVAESIAMLRAEAEQGVTHVVATPHFYAQHDHPDRFLQRRAEAETRLREAMAGETGLPQVVVGAEVYFYPGISETDRLLDLTIAGGSCILIEMPEYAWSSSMYQELAEIEANWGLTPVIAHIDRYIGPWHHTDIPKRLAQLPVLVQANASFLLRRSTCSMALKLLNKKQIHLLGSDCHNMTTRKPNLGEAAAVIARRADEQLLEDMYALSRSVLKL